MKCLCKIEIETLTKPNPVLINSALEIIKGLTKTSFIWSCAKNLVELMECRNTKGSHEKSVYVQYIS